MCDRKCNRNSKWPFKQFLYPPPFLLFTSVANIKYADLQNSILMYENLFPTRLEAFTVKRIMNMYFTSTKRIARGHSLLLWSYIDTYTSHQCWAYGVKRQQSNSRTFFLKNATTLFLGMSKWRLGPIRLIHVHTVHIGCIGRWED